MRLHRHLSVAKRKPLAELVERKSLRLWRKIKLLVKVKLGLPTNKTRNKEDLIVDKDISSLEHTRWRCQYHVVFAMVFSITHCCVNFIKASCYSI